MSLYYRFAEPEKQKQTTLGGFGFTVFDGGVEPLDNKHILDCDGGGKNLHIYKLSGYPQCHKCRFWRDCSNTAHIAGEQSEL